MKAVVERAPLLAALSRAVGVVERKQVIPLLGNVMITVGEGSVELRATDLDMEAVEKMSAISTEPGATSISADKLHEIVRKVDAGAQVLIETDPKDPRIRVKAGASLFRMPALPVEDFPQFPDDGLADTWAIPAKLFADMLTRVSFCRSDMNPLTAMSGIHVNVVGGELHVVTCHKSGMALRREPAPAGADISEILLPKFTNQITRWLSEVEGDALISCAPGRLMRVQAGDAMLTAKVYGGPFVNYLNAVKETHECVSRTDQDALSLAIRRVMITGEVKVGSVRLQIADGGIRLGARNDKVGEGSDEIACDYDGPEAQLMINADRFQGALSALRGDQVELGFAPIMDPQVNVTGQVIIRAPSDRGMVINLMQPRA